VTPPAAPSVRRFPWPIYVVGFVLVLAFTLAPVISAVIASVLANANGCVVDEGSIHPCLIAGSDWGENLYTLGVLGWLMLVTLPVGAIALLVLAVVLLIHRTNWRQRDAGRR
jgi:ABC-type Fe3+ transport system permease subunit